MNTKPCNTPIKLDLESIDTDASVPLRAQRAPNEETVSEYAEALERGDCFPPIIVCGPDTRGKYFLADGRHRLAAHKRAGRDKINALIVAQGDFRAAIESGFGRNATHGRPRTRADLAHEIGLALMHCSDWSDSKIAEAVRCHVNTVRNHRKDRQGSMVGPEARMRTGIDGKNYMLPPVPTRPRQGCQVVTPDAWRPGLPASFAPGPGQAIRLAHDDTGTLVELVRHPNGRTLVGALIAGEICVLPAAYADSFVAAISANLIAEAHPHLVAVAPVDTQAGTVELPTITGEGWQHSIVSEREYTVHPLADADMVRDWIGRRFELELSRTELEAALVEIEA